MISRQGDLGPPVGISGYRERSVGPPGLRGQPPVALTSASRVLRRDAGQGLALIAIALEIGSGDAAEHAREAAFDAGLFLAVAGVEQDIAHLGEKPLTPYRRRMQMIFQDPYASLNPRMTVASIIAEPLRYAGASKAYQTERVRELVDLVGLKPDHLQRYPHEFSGGQRQRVGIARALACNPEFIVCDEPISALDVSIQAQVINTLESLQEKLGLSYLFVSHDLSMVRHISHNVGVMYLGCMVERAPVHELYSNMLHPYTQALMSAVPIPDPDIAAASSRIHLSGDVPTPIDPPSGCRFRARCPYATEQCAQERPELREVAPDHFVACHRIK